MHERSRRTYRSDWIRPIPPALVALFALLFAGAAAAATAPDPVSYWGPIPAEHDSVSAVFESKEPVWERAVDLPVEIATFPLDLAVDGAEAAVVWLDERKYVGRAVRRVLFPRIGPFYGRFGVSAGDPQGYGLGFTAVDPTFFGRRNALRIGLRVTQHRNDKATLGLRFARGKGGVIQVGGGYRRTPNARYFGKGPYAAEGNESFYDREVGWGGIGYEHPLGFDLTFETEALFSGVGAFDPSRIEADEIPLSERFAAGLPPGYGHRSDGISYEFGLRHDSSIETGRPERGGTRRLLYSRFRSTDGRDVAFSTYRVEVEQFFPLQFTRRALAVRGVLAWIESSGGDPVPFQRVQANDEPDAMRGWEERRWHDDGILTLSAEYRWPLWNHTTVDGPGLDAYVFAGTGQVFGEFDEIGVPSMRGSVGGGARLIGSGGFVGRVEYGWSREETVFRLTGQQIFQYGKGGLFFGRNPIPSR